MTDDDGGYDYTDLEEKPEVEWKVERQPEKPKYNFIEEKKKIKTIVPFDIWGFTLNQDWEKWIPDWDASGYGGEFSVKKWKEWPMAKSVSLWVWPKQITFLYEGEIKTWSYIRAREGFDIYPDETRLGLIEWRVTKHVHGLKDEPSRPYTRPEVEIRKTYLHVDYKESPFPEDWQWAEVSHQGSQYHEIQEGSNIFSISVVKHTRNDPVPEFVKNAYYAYLAPNVDIDFLNPHTYSEYMGTYVRRTYEGHYNQIKGLLTNVDKTVRIVAPADGVGTAVRAWTGPKHCSDIKKSPWTHSEMRQESISETLEHLCADDLLILSYCSAFLTEQDRFTIQMSSCSVAVIDSCLHPLGIPDMLYVSRFCQLYNWRWGDIPYIHPETPRWQSNPPFSNNVLDLQRPLKLLDWGLVGDWLLTAHQEIPVHSSISQLQNLTRPTNEDSSYTWIAHSISSVLDAGVNPVYFVPIGKVVTTIQRVNSLSTRHMLYSRTVYEGNMDDYDIISRMTHELVGSRLFFWSVLSSNAISWKINSTKRVGCGVVTFCDPASPIKVTYTQHSMTAARGFLTVTFDRGSQYAHGKLLQSIMPRYDSIFVKQYTLWSGVVPHHIGQFLSPEKWKLYCDEHPIEASKSTG